MSDEIKNEKARGYSLGYAAGKKRAAKEDAAEELRVARAEKWNAAFLASLGGCVSQQHWTRGDKPIVTLPDRVLLAKEFADEAMRHMK
jgi:hypothetical protein